MTNLKKIRMAKGKALSDVAKHIGISKQRYFYFENGEFNAKHEEIARKVAEYLGVSVFEALGEDNLIIKPQNEKERKEAKKALFGK